MLVEYDIASRAPVGLVFLAVGACSHVTHVHLCVKACGLSKKDMLLCVEAEGCPRARSAAVLVELRLCLVELRLCLIVAAQGVWELSVALQIEGQLSGEASPAEDGN